MENGYSELRLLEIFTTIVILNFTTLSPLPPLERGARDTFSGFMQCAEEILP